MSTIEKFDESQYNIQIYDAGEGTPDRYTVVYMNDAAGKGLYDCVGMSADPFHPQGIGQHGTAMPGEHLGKRITFEELPSDCRRLVRRDLGLDQLVERQRG